MKLNTRHGLLYRSYILHLVVGVVLFSRQIARNILYCAPGVFEINFHYFVYARLAILFRQASLSYRAIIVNMVKYTAVPDRPSRQAQYHEARVTPCQNISETATWAGQIKQLRTTNLNKVTDQIQKAVRQT